MRGRAEGGVGGRSGHAWAGAGSPLSAPFSVPPPPSISSRCYKPWSEPSR